MSDWQPIKTAPKDGTHVLLYYRFARERYMAEGWWEPYSGVWVTQGQRAVRATHWRPRPEPPD